MALDIEFKTIPLSELHSTAEKMKEIDARFMQTHAVNTDEGVDLYYSFMVDGQIQNYCVKGVTEGDSVPSITDLFLAAFVFENEARELFGVDMRDIAIDFGGNMYTLAEKAPMTFVSPEQKAAIEKQKKADAAKAAKLKAEAAKAQEGDKAPAQAQAQDADAALEEKLKGMDPEKAAKVRAAMEAKKAREAAQQNKGDE